MSNPRSDEIAREAARLIETGITKDVQDALHRAADSLGYHDVPLPGHGRVRKHAQAMSMQSRGAAAHAEQRIRVWEVAEQIMTVFEHTMPDVTSLLVGRAAEGLIDAGVTIHIRLYTRRIDQVLAGTLMDFGYEEPQFQSLQTRFGRLQQIRLTEQGYEVVLTRCMPETLNNSRTDIVTGNPIAAINLTQLRRQIATAQGEASETG